MFGKVSLLVLIVCAAIPTIRSKTHHPHSEKETTFLALNRLFDFIIREPKLNIDGLFGVVHAKAILESALQETRFSPDKRRLLVLHGKSEKIIQTVSPNLPNHHGKYEIFKHHLLDAKVWRKNINFNYSDLMHKYKRTSNISHFIEYLMSDGLSGELSDSCVVNLLENFKTKKGVCAVSKKCHHLMINSKQVTPGYGITHRLLFLQIAKAKGCVLDARWFRERTISYCSQMFWEASEAERLNISKGLLDLLMEQIYLCGYEGFADFFKKTWFQLIVDSQHPMGCFSANNDRTKRSYNTISYGCSDHTTGLAAATLSLFYCFLLKRGRFY